MPEYIDHDQDHIVLRTFWQKLYKLVGTKLIPSAWFPLDDGMPGTWLILTSMVISMAQKKLAGIGSRGIPIWWWDLGIHLSDRLI